MNKYHPVYQNQYSEEYMQACYDRSMEELDKMTWDACTGEVVIGMLLFDVAELKAEIAELKEKLNERK